MGALTPAGTLPGNVLDQSPGRVHQTACSVTAWKVELQKFADDANLRIRVSHFPPGTSKWNKIEHRLFCHITQNWRGKPLRTFETIVELIGNTRTKAGLKVKAKLDAGTYSTGTKIAKAQMQQLALQPHTFHGEWNYVLQPRKLPR